MLKLKRLELLGFKSFADRTEMRFNGSGITAVVGPNGCGKSNLADAISWVLGEQSAKTLRGTRMEDVIFAGTRERKPLSMAAVTITFVDPEGTLEPAETTAHSNGDGAKRSSNPQPREITITRRLFRSGESEYLIDGRPARLRDIQDLFMGTGLGPDCYAIIEQGRIQQILSARPQDRRALIEEAAGISKFKTKRRLAEAKLESARHNLSRVFDILEEVGRQLNSLKRQATKARRYQELRGELSSALRQALVGRYRVLEREAARIALELNLLSAQVRALREEIAGKENRRAAIQGELEQTASQLAATQNRYNEARVQAERVRGQIEAQLRQAAEIEKRVALDQVERQQTEQRLQELNKLLEDSRLALSELERELGEARQTLELRAQYRNTLQAQLKTLLAEAEARRQALLRLLGELASLRNEVVQIDEYLAALQRDAARVEREHQAALQELDHLRSQREEVAAEERRIRQFLAEITEVRRRLEAELAERTAELSQARQALEAGRQQRSSLEARRQSLEHILAHRAYTREAVKRFFELVETGQLVRPLGILADFLEVDAGWEKAVEQFLNEELEYVLVPSWDAARRGLELLERQGAGRVTFLVVGEPGELASMASEPAFGPETRALARLADVVHLHRELDIPLTELLPRLNHCFLVEDPQHAWQLARAYPRCFFLLRDGTWYHGCTVSGGSPELTGPLALKRELRELTLASRQLERQIEQIQAQVTALEREIQELGTRIEAVRAEQQSREKELVALEQRANQLDQQLQRTALRVSVSASEAARLCREQEQAQLRRQQLRTQLNEMEERRQRQEQQATELAAQAQELQRTLERASEDHSASRAILAGLEERYRSACTYQHQLEAQRKDLLERRDRLTKTLTRLAAEREALLNNNRQLAASAEQLVAETNRLAAEMAALEQKVTELRNALAGAEQELNQARAQLEQLQEQRSSVEIRLAEHKSELRHLEDTARKELAVELSELAAQEPSEVDEIAVAEAEERVQQLRERIEALGPVNPQALEEYEEVQQRYDFLNAQRQDLLDSIRDTERAIKEIDQETRRRFKQAFEAINENFQRLFRTLFGGGNAEIRLSDPEDIGESGVEIVASPPGKRLQNVLLLSGGEKALTALALVLAIFQYQPSPFCLMDEVDAPLDDANIDRLMRLLKELSQQTQFILITHAKRTMEAADALYGVTMEEPGVSKLVSVRFTERPHHPEVTSSSLTVVASS